MNYPSRSKDESYWTLLLRVLEVNSQNSLQPWVRFNCSVGASRNIWLASSNLCLIDFLIMPIDFWFNLDFWHLQVVQTSREIALTFHVT